MKIEDLYSRSQTELEEGMRKARITLEARRTIQKMAEVIKKAGGDISKEDLANTTLGQLAVMAAQNAPPGVLGIYTAS